MMKTKHVKRVEALLRSYKGLHDHVNRAAGIAEIPASLRGCIAFIEDGNCDRWAENALGRIREIERKFPQVAADVSRILKN